MGFQIFLFFLFILAPSYQSGNMRSGKTCNAEGEESLKKELHYRIIFGIRATANQFPFMAEIVGSMGHWCGGVIIHESFILTANHCVRPFLSANGYPLSFLRIIVGNDVQKLGGVTHQIKKIIVLDNESYVRKYLKDIALIQLMKPIIFNDKMQPVVLAKKSPLPGETGWVIGFGSTKINKIKSRSFDQHMMAVQIPVVSFNHCKRVYRMLSDDVICAGDNTPRDSCQGDSGGPFVINNTLVGLVSRGIGCGNPGIPGIYTNVYLYEKWIRQTIEEESCLSKSGKEKKILEGDYGKINEEFDD